MASKYEIQPVDVGASFLKGRVQQQQMRANERAEAREIRADEAAINQELLGQFGNDAGFILDAYGTSPKAMLAAAQGKVREYSDKYLETKDPQWLEAADNLQGAIKQGPDAVAQMTSAVANEAIRAGAMGPGGEVGKKPTQTTKAWTNPDVAVNPESGKPEYFITNQATGETKWLGKGPEEQPDEVGEAVRKAQALADLEVETAQRMAKTPGTAEYDRLQKASEAEKKAGQATSDLRYQMVRNKGEAVSLLRDISAGSTGFDGFIKWLIPGSKAFTDQARVRELENHIALGALQELKEKSPTGATGFGQMSEKELKLLTEAIASLDSKMGDYQFKSQLEKVISHYERSIAMLDFEHMNPPRLERGRSYSPEEKTAVARDFAQMAIDAGIPADDVVAMLRMERLYNGQ